MDKVKFLIIYLALVLQLLSGISNAEPSAFELQSGATKKDLKNIQSANKNLENIAIDYSARIQALEQSCEGLKSVVEGQALRIKVLMDSLGGQDKLLKRLQSDLAKQNETITAQSAIIEELQKKHSANANLIDQLNSKINDLVALVTKLNQDIISQLDKLQTNQSTQSNKINPPTQGTQSHSNANKQQSQAKKPASTQSPATNSATATNKEILDEARKLYRAGSLNEARKLYQKLVDNNYRVASSLYMLGEIAYQKGEFKEAISFYKKSASLDEKASYMPVLLWHTAWAFRYSKDMTNYNKFLDSLVYLYPESEQGKKAKDLKNKQKT